MKKILGAVCITVLLAFIGCSGSGGGQDNISRSGNGRGGTQTGPNNAKGPGQAPSPATVNSNPGMWGTISPQQSTAQNPVTWGGSPMGIENPNDMTRLFLTTNLEPEMVGGTTQSPDVNYPQLPSCLVAGTHCAVVMAMPLVVGANTLSAAMNSGTAVPITQGSLTIVIYDSLVGTQASDGTIITPFPVYVNLNTNYANAVTRNAFNVQFGDSLGTITLSGQITNGATSGTISFQNYDNVDQTGQGAVGTLGTFQINTCSIFTQQCS